MVFGKASCPFVGDSAEYANQVHFVLVLRIR
jgi:hypothetical protein